MSWLARLTSALDKTSSKLSDGIAGIFTKGKLDNAALEKLEELLIEADMGAGVSAEIVKKFAEQRFDNEVTPKEVKTALAKQIAEILAPVSKKLEINSALKPHVILVMGVNGNGKTTTIGKLAHWLKEQGHQVILAAADTFRAAAVEQLKIWGARAGCEVINGEVEADPASVAFRAVQEAKNKCADVLLIDTAGRLQNKTNLMAELQKIIKVIKKLDDTAPHSVLLVLDATTGQNALSQVETFKAMVGVTGLLVTKLDGTAKGGVVVALAKKFQLPIHAVGVGEGIDDLRPFSPQSFAHSLVGLPN